MRTQFLWVDLACRPAVGCSTFVFVFQPPPGRQRSRPPQKALFVWDAEEVYCSACAALEKTYHELYRGKLAMRGTSKRGEAGLAAAASAEVELRLGSIVTTHDSRVRHAAVIGIQFYTRARKCVPREGGACSSPPPHVPTASLSLSFQTGRS
jgi:hypothetical protein